VALLGIRKSRPTDVSFADQRLSSGLQSEHFVECGVDGRLQRRGLQDGTDGL
jgi:hypothetical protein